MALDPFADVEQKFLAELRRVILDVGGIDARLWDIAYHCAAPPEGFDPLDGLDQWIHDLADESGVDDAVKDLRAAIYEYARGLRPLILARVRAEGERRVLDAQLALPSPAVKVRRRRHHGDARRSGEVAGRKAAS